jgi:nucleoside-diphosphate-sugar epimerase
VSATPVAARDAVQDGALPTDGLAAADFTCLAGNGLGDAQNSYAHSLAWFRGRAYVGTSRNALALLKLFPPRQPPALDPWPVPVPARVEDLDLHGEILTVDPRVGNAEVVHRSPDLESRTGGLVPRELGYRGMTVFQGRSDAEPALYVSSISSVARGGGARLLRSGDGETFEPVSAPGLGNPAIATFRSLVAFGGHLYVAPTGEGTRWNTVRSPILVRSDDPAAGEWELACPPGFGDAGNAGIFEVAEFDGCLYAGTFNALDGFQVWRSAEPSTEPGSWTKVLERGAQRGPHNEMVISMCPFQGALYIGTGIQNGGYDRTNGVGPAAAELIRLWPDGSWDLIVGEPRRTPDGVKRPLSGAGAGFDNGFAGYVWRMAEHDGWLYATTFDWSVFLPYAHRPPAGVRRMMRRLGAERMVTQCGGFTLLRSRDGTDWTVVSGDGLGNPYNHGGRTLLSTPSGLLLGTANPFGPQVAARLMNGWTYTDNPSGGAELWLGRPRPQRRATWPATSLRGHTDGRRGMTLVTGATGFLGSALLAELLARGEHVRVMATADTVDRINDPDSVELVVGDIGDGGALARAVRGARTVYHLAGALPGASREALAAVNVHGTARLLRALREDGHVSRVVLASSVAVYEGAFIPDDWPLTEHSALGPRRGPAQLRAYGESKIAAERLLCRHARADGYEPVILRPSTCYGPGNADFAEMVDELLGRPDGRAGDRGSFPVQLLHVSDAAEAFRLAGTVAAAAGETMTLAGAEAVEYRQLQALCRRLAGIVELDEPELGLVGTWRRYRRPYDVSRARQVLGFQPRVSLAEGMREIVALAGVDRENGEEASCVSW